MRRRRPVALYHWPMVRLCRTVRFSVGEGRRSGSPDGVARNGYAGWPRSRGMARYFELDIMATGEVDSHTGYFLNIQEIDRAVREAAIPLIERQCHETPDREPAEVLPSVARALSPALGGRLASVRWRISPTYSVELETERMNRVVVRQRFEFAASHRLHCAALSDEENRRLFGKCNSPNGHGHNYVVEPAVVVRLDPSGPPPFTLEALERLTGEAIIARFDHKHLNEDTRDFATQGGLNPSVENIAKVCFDLLAPGVREAGAELASVTVWETEKTSATYPA